MLHLLYTLRPPADDDDPDHGRDDVLGGDERPDAPATAWRLTIAPGGRCVGLAAGDLLEVVDTTGASAWPLCRFRLPVAAHETRVAVHPSGESIVVATRGTIWALSRRPTDPTFAASVASDWGEPRAISFSPDGKVVWASFAEGDAHHVCALDWASHTLALVGALSLGGALPTAKHEFSFHPAASGLAAVTRNTADGGSAVCFVEIEGDDLHALAVRLGDGSRTPTAPFSVAGFSAGGDRLATVSRARIDQWIWPGGQPREALELQDGMTFDHGGCFVGDELVALVRAASDQPPQLAVFDAHLALRTHFTYGAPGATVSPADQRIVGLQSLAQGRLLVVGERRAGVFALEA